MPIFDFKCNECGHTFELLVGCTVTTKAPDICPACFKGTVEKQFSASGQSFDVVGGFAYEYGRKAWTKQSAEQRSTYLTKDANGKYKNPY
jgi:putative FmdB family regulatory protein